MKNNNDMLTWFLMEILMCRSQNTNPLLSLPSLLSSTVHTQIFPFIHIPYNNQPNAHNYQLNCWSWDTDSPMVALPASHSRTHNTMIHHSTAQLPSTLAFGHNAPNVLFILLCFFRVKCVNCAVKQKESQPWQKATRSFLSISYFTCRAERLLCASPLAIIHRPNLENFPFDHC